MPSANRSSRLVALGVVGMLALLVPATTAAAAVGPRYAATASDIPAASSDLRPRLERACLRIPNLEVRTANLLERLQGDESVRGSLAWLEAAIARAEANGRNDLAEVLKNRLAVRVQTLEVLRLRVAELENLKQRCIDKGVDL